MAVLHFDSVEQQRAEAKRLKEEEETRKVGGLVDYVGILDGKV